MWIWVEPRKSYSRVIIFLTKGALPESYFQDIHRSIAAYAKEQKHVYGKKEEIQCQRGIITPRFIEMYTMLGDEEERIRDIFTILSKEGGK